MSAVISAQKTPKRPQSPLNWVNAAPFRAHLHHLLAASGLPWRVIAAEARVPERTVDVLLHGRGGRPLRRLPPDIARRLLAMREDLLADLARRPVPAAQAREAVESWCRSGGSVAAISRRCPVEAGDIESLLDPETRYTTRRIELLIVTAAVEAGVDIGPDAEEPVW